MNQLFRFAVRDQRREWLFCQDAADICRCGLALPRQHEATVVDVGDERDGVQIIDLACSAGRGRLARQRAKTEAVELTKEFLADRGGDLAPLVTLSTCGKLALLISVLIATAVRTPMGTRNATRKKAK